MACHSHVKISFSRKALTCRLLTAGFGHWHSIHHILSLYWQLHADGTWMPAQQGPNAQPVLPFPVTPPMSMEMLTHLLSTEHCSNMSMSLPWHCYIIRVAATCHLCKVGVSSMCQKLYTKIHVPPVGPYPHFGNHCLRRSHTRPSLESPIQAMFERYARFWVLQTLFFIHFFHLSFQVI